MTDEPLTHLCRIRMSMKAGLKFHGLGVGDDLESGSPPKGEGSPPLYPIDDPYVMDRSFLIGDRLTSSRVRCDQSRGDIHLGIQI